MIYTVTFNPSLDYIVAVDDFQLGLTNRTSSELILPGGKGINVSTLLMNLGIESTALGFMAGFTGDAAVLMTIQRVLRDDEISRIADAIVSLQEREDTTLPAMRSQLAACEKAIDNMLNAIQRGIITASTKERLEQLETQRQELKLSILQVQMTKPRYTKEQIVGWINRFKYGSADDPQYQKQIIDTFINSIYVFDDKMVFTYNFQDGTEPITLAEIEATFGSDLAKVAPPEITPA